MYYKSHFRTEVFNLQLAIMEKAFIIACKFNKFYRDCKVFFQLSDFRVKTRPGSEKQICLCGFYELNL